MTNLIITTTEQGYYLTAVSKGVKYGQGYKDISEAEAIAKFRGLVKTYETKGDAYVARYGSAY